MLIWCRRVTFQPQSARKNLVPFAQVLEDGSHERAPDQNDVSCGV